MYGERFMGRVVALSAHALPEPWKEPCGAVVVWDGTIVGEGPNHARAHFDLTFHGEVEAIRGTCARLQCLDLTSCELYVSSEPCALCVATRGVVGISKLYDAASMNRAAVAFADGQRPSGIPSPSTRREPIPARGWSTEACRPNSIATGESPSSRPGEGDERRADGRREWHACARPTIPPRRRTECAIVQP